MKRKIKAVKIKVWDTENFRVRNKDILKKMTTRRTLICRMGGKKELKFLGCLAKKKGYLEQER